MRSVLLVIPIAFVACTHKKAATTVSAAPAAPSPAATTAAPAQPPPAANTANLAVSDDLARACQLHLDDAARAPKFNFDDFTLLPEDRGVLEQVATCVTKGPLKGRQVMLTGRADPRGTEEYNLGLGVRRANTVSEYLTRLGVPTRQLSASTRGELDARGTDDNTYRIDRRVDIELRN